VELLEPYKPRAVRCLDVVEHDGWRVKVYGIAYEGERPAQEFVGAALDVTLARLPSPAVTDDRYGVGFIGIHEGRGSNFVFVDWWALENELHHHVWFSSMEEPTKLRPETPDDPISCAWDLAVISHEQQAWVTHVLANPAGPDLDAYLGEQLNADV
jgi:hypothetical protein